MRPAKAGPNNVRLSNEKLRIRDSRHNLLRRDAVLRRPDDDCLTHPASPHPASAGFLRLKISPIFRSFLHIHFDRRFYW
jgi:hypothetical protein